MNLQPWASAPRDGTWILPYTGHKQGGGCGYDAPQKWDAKAGMWVGDDGVHTDDLDDCAKGFFALPIETTKSVVLKAISQDAFDALCTLSRMRVSPSRDAARLVLVDGIPRQDAAQQTGITPGGVSNALKPIRAALQLAKIATKHREST